MPEQPKVNGSVCALCLEQRELARSHVIPQWAYRRTKEGSAHGVMVNLTHPHGPIAVKSNEELAVDLLCAGCEAAIKVFDDAGAVATLQLDRTYPLVTTAKPIDGGLMGAGIPSPSDLARFAYSLFWRADAYNLVVSERQKVPTDLGAMREPIRQHLLGGPEPVGQASLLIQAYFVEDEDEAGVTAWNDHRPRLASGDGGCPTHLCFLHGVEFALHVCDRAEHLRFAFREPEWPLVVMPFKEWRFAREVAEQVNKARAKPGVWASPNE